jgi:hypothetical protein
VTQDRSRRSSNVTTVKSQRNEENSDLATRDSGSECESRFSDNTVYTNIASGSFDDSRCSKKPKVHYGCCINRIWWLTVSIDSVNQILGRLDAMIKQNEMIDKIFTGVILDPSNGLTRESREILDAARNGLDNDPLYESRDMLDVLKDQMKQEGGKERDDLE